MSKKKIMRLTFLSIALVVAVQVLPIKTVWAACDWGWGSGVLGAYCTPDEYSGGIISDEGCGDTGDAGNKLIRCEGGGGARVWTYTCYCTY